MMQQQLLLQLAEPPAPTLENFVPGRNGAALQALRDIASGAGGERFVYLWGGPGSGRTHLLRGLVQAAGANGAWYLQGAAALGEAGARLIAVDDVQLLGADGQIRLFDLYNRVRTAGGALVASGDAAPAQLALREDLRSRLAWGLALALRGLVIANQPKHAPRDMASLIGILDALDRYSLEQKRPVTLPLVRDALEAMKDKPYTAS